MSQRLSLSDTAKLQYTNVHDNSLEVVSPEWLKKKTGCLRSYQPRRPSISRCCMQSKMAVGLRQILQ